MAREPIRELFIYQHFRIQIQRIWRFGGKEKATFFSQSAMEQGVDSLEYSKFNINTFFIKIGYDYRMTGKHLIQ